MKFRSRIRKVRGVRWREDTGYEMRCHECRTYWPLDPEFWPRSRTLQRCRACETKRNRQARNDYYRRNREYELARQKAYDDHYRKKAVA